MWVHLAEHAGVPVSELKRSYPEADFRLVYAKYRHEPLPGERLDWWGARLTAAVLAASPNRRRGKIDPRKFAPDWYARSEPPKPQSAANIVDTLRALTTLMGGKVIEEGKPDG